MFEYNNINYKLIKNKINQIFLLKVYKVVN